MRTIRVHLNKWGNCCCFDGTKIVNNYGNQLRATFWAMTELDKGDCKLSTKSYITIEDVDNMRKSLK